MKYERPIPYNVNRTTLSDISKYVLAEKEPQFKQFLQPENPLFHSHDGFIEFHLVLSGTATHCINEIEYVVGANDLMIINPGDIHRYKNVKQLKIYLGVIPSNFFLQHYLTLKEIPGFSSLFKTGHTSESPGNYFCEKISLTSEESGKIVATINEYLLETEGKNHLSIFFQDNILIKLILFFLLFYITRHTEQKKLSIEIVTALNYIENNLSKELSNDKICEVTGLTETRLCVLFKREMGVPIHKYINRLRISKAIVLLRDNNLFLTDVANHVGYNSLNYFSRIFTKMTGLSPGEFKKKMNNSVLITH